MWVGEGGLECSKLSPWRRVLVYVCVIQGQLGIGPLVVYLCVGAGEDTIAEKYSCVVE